jgi:hypothetical protein
MPKTKKPKNTKLVEEKALRPFVEHPDLGKCYIINQTQNSTYIEMFNGRRFFIPKSEPQRTKAINFVKEIEKEPLLAKLIEQKLAG